MSSPWKILHGDCLAEMEWMANESVDSIVTDPPYGLNFMNKHWDYEVPGVDVWRECLRVLKPGGHLLSFFGTRTYHRGVVLIEDAGFEIRDQIGWVYGSGFPKSLDVSKAIDKAAGAEREVVGINEDYLRRKPNGMKTPGATAYGYSQSQQETDARITTPATEMARRYAGWGTALKPAWEPIVMARKPIVGTVAQNFERYGVGGLNIDGCRVEHTTVDGGSLATNPHLRSHINGGNGGHIISTETDRRVVVPHTQGRFPANLIHDGSDEVLAAFPQAPGQQADVSHTAPSDKTGRVYGAMKRQGEPSQDSENEGTVGFKMKPGARRLDAGSAARFFYAAKANKKDRETGNLHPTVKPTDLMRYLCRLVTPTNGLVLDPFMGSGSTGKAALLEGFRFVGIEREAEYINIAMARLVRAEQEGEL